MKRIRIGNDIKVYITVVNGGEWVDLAGKQLELFLNSSFGSQKMTDFGVSGNRIILSLPGASNNLCGSYSVTLKLIEGTKQYLSDSAEEWKLVDNTTVAGTRSKLNTPEEIYINIDIGIIEAVDYNPLINKPSINNIELVGDKTLDQLGIQPAGNYATRDEIPDTSNFIEKIPGKGLSDNNFTNQDKARIEQALKEIERIKSEHAGFAKWFVSEAALIKAIPYPNVGDYAWVGEPYPGVIYQCLTKGIWTNTGKVPESSLSLFLDIIKEYSEEKLSDSNVLSSLRTIREISKSINELKKQIDVSYLHKDKSDKTSYLLSLLDGAEFGNFFGPLATRTGAKIDSEGNGMFTTLSAKQMRILTLIINKLTALAGDFVMTESGEIESVERIDDRTYRLIMVRKHDNDITNLEVDDVLRANLEDLKVNNVSYMGWYRVLSKNTQDNTLNVVMYPASECEGNVNYPPVANMIVHRWGNATNEERQRCWYISSPEGRIVYLTGVYKPKLEASNYASFYGLPVMLDFLKDKGINPKEPYLWVRGLIAQDIIRVDYQGNVEADIVDRGLYDPAVAKGPDPYLCRAKRSTNGRFETHDVWANSCRYRCLKTGTLEVPKWNAADWVQMSGDTELYIKFEKPNGDAFFDVIDCPIIVHVFRGVEEITEDIPDTDIAWSRESGDAASDLAWPSQHPNEKKKIHLGDADCPGESTRFTCTVYVRDGEFVREVQAIETINN